LRLHQWCSCLGTSKDEQLLRTHREICARGVSGEVEVREDLNSAFLQQGFEALDGLRNGMV